ncbi:hypothetical protein CEXT_592921 [Caerostris extrusa]|uniref:Uncharacterized protein n=1 Tax=Caerostris extrusa TaxID=172846 RepID=A0AAV4PRJ2_CAEEX|nr:hypothetical protein CEXT_592921 [Caerostris extrusa]
MRDSLMSHVLEIPITINPAFKGILKPYKGCAGKVPLKQVGRAREKCDTHMQESFPSQPGRQYSSPFPLYRPSPIIVH